MFDLKIFDKQGILNSYNVALRNRFPNKTIINRWSDNYIYQQSRIIKRDSIPRNIDEYLYPPKCFFTYNERNEYFIRDI